MRLVSIPANPVPDDAVTGMLKTRDGVNIRFARWHPPPGRKGTVCLFPGRTEFIEKYFETIRELRARGFAVAMLDWRGQGLSDRALDDPFKGHVGDFSEYELDLDVFMREVVLPDCPPPLFAIAPFDGRQRDDEHRAQGRALVRPHGAVRADDRDRRRARHRNGAHHRQAAALCRHGPLVHSGRQRHGGLGGPLSRQSDHLRSGAPCPHQGGARSGACARGRLADGELGERGLSRDRRIRGAGLSRQRSASR